MIGCQWDSDDNKIYVILTQTFGIPVHVQLLKVRTIAREGSPIVTNVSFSENTIISAL